jgi:hypothetical protein
MAAFLVGLTLERPPERRMLIVRSVTMKRIAAESCCTTPTAIWFWLFMFGVIYGTEYLLTPWWPTLQAYGDTMILVALAGACFANFGRNRTLHCGLTGPLFLFGAVVALLVEAGIWRLDQDLVWAVVAIGVAAAFWIEWRTVGRPRRGSHA